MSWRKTSDNYVYINHQHLFPITCEYRFTLFLQVLDWTDKSTSVAKVRVIQIKSSHLQIYSL